MLCSSKFRLSTLQYIQPDHWLGTRTLVVRRHRSSTASAKKSKPNLKSLQELLNGTREHAPYSPQRSLLDRLQPFNQQRYHLPQEPSHQQHHVPHEQPHLQYATHEQPFRPPRPRNIPHGMKEPSEIPVFPDIGEAEVIPYFEGNVQTWANNHTTSNRMRSFGIDIEDSRKLLKAFTKDVKAHNLSDPQSFTYYGLERFSHEQYNKSIDVIYSTVFFSWAANPSRREDLEKLGVAPATIDFIRRMVKATSRSYPADEFAPARSIHRKVILHVGPTNSGKTHHALRALAASKGGVYAGPLRLLAHEIWHRLNTGKIVPLGAEPDPTIDYKVNGNPKYALPCHMLTGEERKYMPNAHLISCTVEMLPYHQMFDVAVVDEIQLIGDYDRGGGWTSAVHGLMAKELHLCGEETAVPIVQKLLQHTGDEIIVKRYERLTPLSVEKKSLGGNLKNVKKGDCIVTFSRNSIFSIKKKVERETGLKCAVVYGRLPPEVRNEQAALFNNPDSEYDVIIGSDAIGMGLNLKIQRVIFEAMHKHFSANTKKMPLSISSVKQIAGRAGRYGLHEAKVDLGGTTTTLHQDDLPLLRDTIVLPNKPLPFARINVVEDNLNSVLSLLPPGTSMEIATNACKYVGRLPPYLRYTDTQDKTETYKFIDREWNHMSISDKLLILHAPIPWRDRETSNIIKRLLNAHSTESSVKLEDITRGHQFMKVTEDLEAAMNKQLAEAAEGKADKDKDKNDKKLINSDGLMALEALHKILVFYIWMGFRNVVVYSDVNAVVELKERVEKVLNWTLSNIRTDPSKKQPPSAHSRERLRKPKRHHHDDHFSPESSRNKS